MNEKRGYVVFWYDQGTAFREEFEVFFTKAALARYLGLGYVTVWRKLGNKADPGRFKWKNKLIQEVTIKG